MVPSGVLSLLLELLSANLEYVLLGLLNAFSWSSFMASACLANTSPLMSNDHPELDTTELLDDDGIHQSHSLIGVLQWTITLGRFDIATAVMTMSGFRVAPRQGHLDRLKRRCVYLPK
jgi:hypothetical protein